MEQDWTIISDIFEECLKLPVAEQEIYLQNACGNNTALFNEVKSLLKSNHEADDYFDKMEKKVQDIVQTEQFPNRTGEILDKYQITEELGQGGMAIVYKAKRIDGQFEQDVAIKILKRGVDTDEILKRFKYEQQILAGLQHPNIAQIMDGGITADGLPYFVMEFLAADGLSKYVQNQKLSLSDKIKVFKQIAHAVAFAHHNSVVHRDLKPSNILVTEQKNVKLLDFGIAKILSSEKNAQILTQINTRILTPNYASPEQLRGSYITTTSDIYQLGLILYELLAGKHVFELQGKSISEKEAIILNQNPAAPSKVLSSQLAKKVKGDLDTITLKCLYKEPEKRYQSVEQLLEDINNWEQNRPIKARPESWRYSLKKLIQRNQAASIIFFSAIILLLCSTAFYIYHLNEARIKAEKQFQRAEAEYKRASEKDEESQEIIGFFSSTLGETANTENASQKIELMLNMVTPLIEHLPNPSKKANYFEIVGLLYAMNQNYTESIRYFKKVIQVSQSIDAPDFNIITLNMLDIGDSFQKLNQSDSAQVWYLKPLDFKEKLNDATHSQIYLKIGENLLLQHKTEEALQYLKTAEKIYSDNPDILLQAGILYQQKKDIVLAEKYYQKAIEVFKNENILMKSKYYLYLSTLYAQTGQTEKAQRLLESFKNDETGSKVEFIARATQKISALNDVLLNSPLTKLK